MCRIMNLKFTRVLLVAGVVIFSAAPCFAAQPDERGDIMKSDAELKKMLTPEQYRITRQNGTEIPFLNKYWNNKRPGIYVDVITGEPLFSSQDKFESGTGWPSFTKPIKKESILEKSDTSHGMTRAEVRAKKSDSHLGHVFSDGPEPAGLRYCINSAALRFIPVEDLEKEGYAEYLDLFAKEARKESKADKTDSRRELATFGAGCFWGVESAFQEVEGVVSTTVGYMGGALKNPAYEDVCTDKTGYAEVVEVEYDPAKISYEKLLDIFWGIHNPTTLNRQGPDIGTQYRSVVFFHNPEQEKSAQLSKDKLQSSGKLKGKIVTEIVSAKDFYKAEEHHQSYFKKQGIKPVCHIPR